jgi:hypothetical protein
MSYQQIVGIESDRVSKPRLDMSLINTQCNIYDDNRRYYLTYLYAFKLFLGTSCSHGERSLLVLDPLP